MLRMVKALDITIVGAGNLGSALAMSLHQAGYAIREIVYPDGSPSSPHSRALARNTGATAVKLSRATLEARVIWFCVPDREITSAATALADLINWRGKIAFHSSGALGSNELRALQQRGASVASVHPLMTFVARLRPSLKQVPFALEGDGAAVRAARSVVRSLGGEAVSIDAKHKTAYHAWGTFASPLLLSLFVTAEEVARLAGIPPNLARRRMLPILRKTLENYAKHGPVGAFSGPIIRGDAATVRKHLQVLRKNPGAFEVYKALARAALKNLPTQNRAALTKLLGGRGSKSERSR